MNVKFIDIYDKRRSLNSVDSATSQITRQRREGVIRNARFKRPHTAQQSTYIQLGLTDSLNDDISYQALPDVLPPPNLNLSLS